MFRSKKNAALFSSFLWRLQEAFFLFLIVFLVGLAEATASSIPVSLGQLTPAEQWVLENVKTAGKADLKEKYGEPEKERQLRGNFLATLLTDGFHGIKSPGIIMKNAVINGPIDLMFSEVSHAVSLINCRFQGQASFLGCEFKKSLFLLNTVFSQEADFTHVKVGLDLILSKVVFEAPVDFTGASINGSFELQRVRFGEKIARLKLGYMKAAAAVINAIELYDEVYMLGATFKLLTLKGSSKVPLIIRKINLNSAVIDSFLNISDCNLETLEAAKMQIKGEVQLNNVKLEHLAYLKDSSFYSLIMKDVTWPADPGAVVLEGLVYQNIDAGDGPGGCHKLLTWLDQSRFAPGNYMQLETYLRRNGYPDNADEVYIQGKRRVVLDRWWRPDHLVTLVFWDFLTGYGRKPARTLWLGLLIVFIGVFFFDHRNFEPSFLCGWGWMSDNSTFKVAAVRFFLSLDEFLPGVDLGLAKLWQIDKISFPTLVYYNFHRMAGWILIPVGVAAVLANFKGAGL